MKKIQCNADLHNHIAHSEDSMPKDFNKVIDYASKRLGRFGILGISNTREEKRYEEFAHLDGYKRRDLGNSFYVPEKELWVVRGQEVKTRDGHILVIGGREGEYLRSGVYSSETLDQAKERGLINMLVHGEGALGTLNKFRKQAAIPSEHLNFPIDFSHLFSGFEIFNPQSSLPIPFVFPLYANNKALEFYINNLARWTTHAQTRPIVEEGKKLGAKVGAIASSDGHSVKDIGICYTALTMPHPDEIGSNEMLNWYLDGAIRDSQLLDEGEGRLKLDCSPKVVKRFALFNGKREPAKIAALEHAILGVGKYAWKRFVKRECIKLIG